MSFLRRNKKDATPDDAEAKTPPPATPDPAPDGGSEEKKSGGGPIAGIRQWLIDSYNGIYKIVLEPSMPKTSTVLMVIVGIVFGLLWGYVLNPTTFTGANPNRLNQPAQDQWIKMVAANYDRGFYADEQASSLLSRIDNPTAAIQRMLADGNLSAPDQEALQGIQQLATSVSGTATPQDPGFVSGLLGGWLVPIILMSILVPIAFLLWRILIFPNFGAALIQRVKMARDPEYKAQVEKQRAELKIAQENRRLVEQMNKAVTVDEELGEPVMKRASIFAKGRTYDDSFEIELPLDKGGDFLGQCGAVISEATDPDPVAVEVWLFDMQSQQNLKKVFVTQAGYADAAVKAKVDADVANPATDIIIAQPGSTATIDSDKIRLQANMMAVEVGADARYESFQMQVQAWQKGASGTPAVPTTPAAGAPPPIPPAKPLPSYDDIQFDPPPAMPSSSQPPAIPPAKPLPSYDDIEFDPPPAMPSSSQPSTPPSIQPLSSPPPASPPSFGQSSPPSFGQSSPPPTSPPSFGQPQQPLSPPPPAPSQFPPSFGDEDDDDPFGGTGDFTPLSN